MASFLALAAKAEYEATLEVAGLIERSRRSSTDVWRLTATGRAHLDTVRSEMTLPEAPQHERWREARSAATERIAGFRADMRSITDEATALREADHEASSATWFEISERLRHAGRLLASAIHCLREWPEPHDAIADIDHAPYGQQVRRQTRGWDSETPF